MLRVAVCWRRPVQNRWPAMKPSRPHGAIGCLSKDLTRRGFRFVGSTICYAFMQATGMVNDHLVGCYRHRDLR